MANKKGLFITFEGGEGSGKSTLMQKIQQELSRRKLPFVATREPGGSPLGEQIRQWLLNRDPAVSIGIKAELFLFLASRAQHVEQVIAPALDSGKIVLCDRFSDSTIAYQGIARGLGMEYVNALCVDAAQGLKPALTFFLEIHPEEGLRRTRKSAKENAAAGEMDRIESEKMEFHHKVLDGMRLLARKEPARIVVLDATQSPEKVFQDAFNKLEPLLKS